MKNITLMMVLATLTLAAVSCGPKKQKQEEQPQPKNLKGKALDAAWILMNQVPYEETTKSNIVTTKPKVTKAK